jgi:putative flippase GtrA
VIHIGRGYPLRVSTSSAAGSPGASGADRQPPSRVAGSWAGLSGRLAALGREFAKFGIVGAVSFVVDVGVFNLLRFHDGAGILYDRPLTAKAISTVLATIVAYLGNRYWTYRNRERIGFAREYSLFFLFNAIGLLISLSCLAISHYGLGLTTPLADNISANVVGLGLGTLFRFWAYRRYVFPISDQDDALTRELRQPV